MAASQPVPGEKAKAWHHWIRGPIGPRPIGLSSPIGPSFPNHRIHSARLSMSRMQGIDWHVETVLVEILCFDAARDLDLHMGSVAHNPEYTSLVEIEGKRLPGRP